MQKSKLKNSSISNILSSKLCHVLGCSSSSSANFSLNHQNGNLFYLAGNMLVETSGETNRQISYLIGVDKHSIKCFLVVSSKETNENCDLIIGEGIGKSPFVYRCSKDGKSIRWKTSCHRFGVSNFFSSEKIPIFVSVGNQTDLSIHFCLKNDGKSIYNCVTKQKLVAGSFSPCLSYFAGIGKSTITIWHFPFIREESPSKIASPRSKPRVIKWNEILVENQKSEVTFVDVKWISNNIYILCRQKKILVFSSKCVFLEEILLDCPKCTCFELFNDKLCIGCNSGIVIIFDLESKSVFRELPRPLPLHRYNFDPINLTPNPSFKFANVQSLISDFERKRLYLLKSDSTIFVWDISNLFKLALRRSLLNHVKGILEMQWNQQTLVSIGNDLTARVWSIFNTPFSAFENPFCKYLFRILHLNDDPAPFKGVEYEGLTIKSSCLKDMFLMIGDSKGCLHVFSFGEESFQTPLKSKKLHNSEITSLALTPESADSSLNVNLLATASRDRKTQILDCANDLQIIVSFEDFLCTIVDVKFVFNSEIQVLQLLSVGSDKSIIVREYRPGDLNFFVKVKVEMERTEKIISCFCDETFSNAYFLSERKVKGWSVETLKTFPILENSEKSYVNVQASVGDSLMVISGSDRVIRIYSKANGSYFSSINSGENVSCLKLVMDDCFLFVSSFDGSIALWELIKKGEISRFKKHSQRKSITFEAEQIFVEEESVDDSLLHYTEEDFEEETSNILESVEEAQSKFLSHNPSQNHFQAENVFNGQTVIFVKKEEEVISEEKKIPNKNESSILEVKKDNFFNVSNSKNQDSFEFSKATPSQKFNVSNSSEIVEDRSFFFETPTNSQKFEILPDEKQAQKSSVVSEEQKIETLQFENEITNHKNESKSEIQETIESLKATLSKLQSVRNSLNPNNENDQKSIQLIDSEISKIKIDFSDFFGFTFSFAL